MAEKDNMKVNTSPVADVETGTAEDVEAIMKKYDRESNTRIWEGTPKQVIRFLLAAFSVLMLYMNLFANWDERVRRSLFVGFVIILSFLVYPMKKGSSKKNSVPIYDIILMVLGAGAYFYFVFNFKTIIGHATRISQTEVIVGVIGILILAETCRRVVGIPILCVATFFVGYAFYNGLGQGRAFAVVLKSIVYNLFYTTSGVIGTPIGVCSTYIALFILFGAFLEATGISEFFIQLTNIQSAAAASERVFEFLSEEELEDESAKMANVEEVEGDVVFSHVKFSYPSVPDKEIIHDFSVHVKPGQKAAIVGPTGAGKTTLVNLLMRFFEPTGGTITIDGVDTKDMTRENVHRKFGMVLQDTWLFEGSVRENLLYNNENVSEETMINACKACGIHSFIKALPQGYDTILTDNTSISAGQKQLLTIARAMIQNSPMLILDEATSSVDTRTELLTQKAMDQLTQKRTSFVIAHRLSTIKNADIILVMRDGDIVEQGNHEELLAKGGFYADLYTSQFEQSEVQA